MKKLLVGAALAAMAATSAQAATLVVDVSGIESNDLFGDPINVILGYDIGADSHVVGIAWDVLLYADWPSWLSEIAVSFNGIVNLTPGINDSFDGYGEYAGYGYLPDYGLDFYVGSDGLLTLEFFESYDDWIDDWDGVWVSGTLTITYEPTAAPGVPEPATWAMMIGGFGLVGAASRLRRRRALTA